MSLLGSVRTWLDERLEWDDLIAPLRKKTVPLHRLSYWYFLGGITLFLFIVQVITGILLLLYYRPGANEAFESVQYIMTKVQFGWLIRSIHSWSANLMIFTAFAHMFSVLFLKAYRKPREMTWISGMILLFLVLGFGFSGYLLPWNTLAFFATKVGTEITGQVPVIGKPLMIFLRGGEEVTGATLTRFFGFHVAVLPGLATLLILVHLLLVQRLGISVPPKLEAEWKANPTQRREMKFFPSFMLRELMAWYVALGVLGALAAIFPWNLGVKADPFISAPAGIKPEWYFLFMFQTLKLIPPKIWIIDGEVLGVLVLGLIGALWVFLPFLERGHPSRAQRWITGIGISLCSGLHGRYDNLWPPRTIADDCSLTSSRLSCWPGSCAVRQPGTDRPKTPASTATPRCRTFGVSQEKFSQDIHAQKGLTCISCHGGDPTSDDADKAMSSKAGWKGKIDRKQIPKLCGSCHSDPDLHPAVQPKSADRPAESIPDQRSRKTSRCR